MNSTNRSSKKDIENWVIPTCQRLGLRNYSVAIAGSSEKGDGYLGDITFVEIVGKTKENEEKSFNFVLKCGKKSSQLRDVIPIRSAFENEIYFYTEILPTYMKFQEEKGIKEPFNSVAKCYDTLILEEMEVLILDDLKKLDFELWDRKRPMNGEHIRTVMRLYGKLHAISFALRDQRPEIFNKFAEELKDVMEMMKDSLQTEDNNLYRDLINIATEKGELAIAEKAILLQKELPKMNELTDSSDPYAVILHGDCWNNNFMFKYKDTEKTKPSQVCFLDFQLCRVASPVYDLSYFLFCCISEDDVKNFDEIQRVYHDSLSDFLKELGSDPNKLFPFEELMNQWKKFAKFGLIMMPSLMRFCLSDQEDVVDMAEAAENGADIAEAFSYSVKDVDEYAKRNFPVMSDKGDGFLSDITFVEVQGKTDSDDNNTYNFVIKNGSPNLALRNMMPIRSIFKNEMYFYNEILPTFIKFQAEKGIEEPFNNAPKCYDTLMFEDMEAIIFEDLKKLGYRLHDRKQPMDREHFRTVLETYGKYHALSFALRDQKPEVFQKLKSNMLDMYKIFDETVPKPEEHTVFQDVINLAIAKGDYEIVKKALDLQTEMKNMDYLHAPDDPYAVFTHGDCWNNNFLFKYDDNQKPCGVRLLDFQGSGMGSPVGDLSYFLFTCISEEDVNNFDDIVHIYYDSLYSFLQKLGSNPDTLFPFDELMNQWRRFSKFGLILMPSILKLCLADEEEVPDFVEEADSGADIYGILAYTVKNIEEYGKRSLPVMRLAIDKKFL